MMMIAIVLISMLMEQEPSGIVTLARGTRSAVTDPTQATARTPSDWQALWKSHGGTAPAPAVDFANEMVAAVFLGTRPTGGYGVEIVSSRREGDGLIIEFIERIPPADAIVTQALTSPFHIVKVRRHDGPVRVLRVSPPAPGR